MTTARALVLASLLLAPAALAAHAYAQCSSFQPAYPGLNGPVKALASWDPDGNGPRLVAGGAFTWDGIGSQDYIAYWDGTAWTNLGWGTDDAVNAITTWDPDGDGPLPAQLIIGGEFLNVGADSTGLVEANHIARWDGQSWQALDIGADGPVDALTTWDPDGDGPLPAELVAAGRFTHIGGVWTGGVAHWDGTAWHSFGWGIDGPGAALTVWDPDGDGPEIPTLVVGGSFVDAGAESTGGVVVNNIARWDGTAWRAFGDGQQYPVTAMVSYTPAELTGPTLIVSTARPGYWDGGNTLYWNSGQWSPTTAGPGFDFVSDARSMVLFDADGSGPRLFAAGVSHIWHYSPNDEPPYGYWYEETHYGVMVLSTGSWRFIPADGPTGSLSAQLTALAAMESPSGPSLVVGGPQSHVYQLTASPAAPAFLVQPDGGYAHLGGTLSQTGIANGPGTYQWWTSGAILMLSDSWDLDGPHVSGSHTAHLSINGLRSDMVTQTTTFAPYLTARFRCQFTDPCNGTAYSSWAEFRVSRCSADFNNDGDTGTDADIQAFFACLGGSCCPTCNGADFNGDGDVGTDADIDSFFRVLAGGPC